MIDLTYSNDQSREICRDEGVSGTCRFTFSLSDDLTHPPVIARRWRNHSKKTRSRKARTFAEYSGYRTLADDSGLEVDALDGAPGFYSARYSGAEADDDRQKQQAARRIEEHVPEEKRTARFVCALALCAPRSHGGKEWIVRGSCEGTIGFAAERKEWLRL